jgi:hypothetical protein
MPNMNGRGPQGQGPMTGRRMGRCANKGADTKKPADPASDNQNEKTTRNLPGRGPGSGSGRAGAGAGAGTGRGRGLGRQNRSGGSR